jgi:hypothetical protein
MSSDFVDASLLQLQAAARSPFGTISQTAMNAALAMITAAAPRDEIEAALAIQMACTHMAVMSILSKLDSGFGTERRIAAFGSAATRLMRTYAMQVEVLRRLRHGGHQYVRVEHVHVNSGRSADLPVELQDWSKCEPVKDCASLGQPLERADLVSAHEATVALNICCEDCDEDPYA